MSNRKYPRLASIRRIPDSERKSGVQFPSVMTDEEVLAMGWDLNRLNRIRKVVNTLYPDRHKWLEEKYGKFNATAQ